MRTGGTGEAGAITRDAFYGGRLHLSQPVKGHRSGTDAVLLAAAVPMVHFDLCYDMGAGVGAVGLGIGLLRTGSEVVLVERDPVAVALAWANADVLDAPVAARVVQCDVLDRASLRDALPRQADLVVTNPPFHDAGRGRPSPDAARRAAHVLDDGVGLGDWFAACLDRLENRGLLIAIVSAAALPEVVAALAKASGGLVAKPVQPRANEPAHRVLVRAEKGSRSAFVLAAPLVLHGADGRFTAEADRLHRGDDVLRW